jgi:excisionase family DNA binding protein
MMQTQGLLTVKELSSYLGVSPCTVRRWVKNREIPFIRRKGLGIRFKREDIDKWLDSNSSQPLLETLLLEKCLKASLTSPSWGDRNASGGARAMPKGKSKARHNFGFGAIYQRKTKQGNVRWYLDYRDAKGNRVQKLAVNASSPEEAYQALKCTVIREHNRSCGITGADQELTFKMFSEMYLNDYAKQNKASWKDDQYRLDANMVPLFWELRSRRNYASYN